MEFDTRNIKPKVYHIIPLTIIATAGILLLMRVDHTEQLKWVNVILTVYFALTVCILFDAFNKQLEYNPYSYNTIIYSGFGFYLTSLVMTHSYLTLQCFQHRELFTRHDMLIVLLNSAKNYLRLISPLLLIFSVGLFVSNIVMIRHNARGLVNYLAMALSVAIVLGDAAILLLDRFMKNTGNTSLLPNLLLNIAAALYLYFECMMTGTIIANVVTSKHHPSWGRDFLIVLGAGLEKDGTPSPLLKGRLNIAADFYREQLRKTGKEAFLITSGGQGADEVQSEARSMKDYLVSEGIPESRILMEDKSVNTAENMQFSKEIITKQDPNAKIAFFTSDFHVFRAGLRARRVKMRAVGMGSPTRWYFWPNASVREFIGLLVNHRMKQGFIILGIVSAYILMTVLAYRGG